MSFWLRKEQWISCEENGPRRGGPDKTTPLTGYVNRRGLQEERVPKIKGKSRSDIFKKKAQRNQGGGRSLGEL